MMPGQPEKTVIVISPAAIVDDASWTTNSVDTKGFAYAVFKFFIGASDIALAALKLQESDTDGSYADVTGAIFGTSVNTAGSTSAVPSATDDNKIFKIFVDLRKRKRYLDLVATAGDGSTGTFAACLCDLYRADITPDTATEQGADECLLV